MAAARDPPYSRRSKANRRRNEFPAAVSPLPCSVPRRADFADLNGGGSVKRTGTNHPKFGMLADSLGIRLYGAVGIMEMLWHFTAQHAPQGDIGKWPDVRIARFVDWPIEDSERLMRALVDCKLLDECATCRFVVHDWHEHCDDAVHMMLARSTLRFASGAIPSLSRFTKDERQKILTAFDEQAHKKRFKTHKSTQKHTENALKHTKNALPSHALPKPCPA